MLSQYIDYDNYEFALYLNAPHTEPVLVVRLEEACLALHALIQISEPFRRSRRGGRSSRPHDGPGPVNVESGMATMGLALRDLFRCNPHPATVTYRLTLLKDDALRLPRMCRRVHVLSGTAWVTVAGRDITLEIGETMSFAQENDFVLISALGAPVNLEIQGDYSPCPSRLRIACWKRFFKSCLAWGWTV
jgi:hypothetical protein